MARLIKALMVFSVALSCFAKGEGQPVSPFPGAELIDKSMEPAKSYMLILGALEKVDRELRPENFKILAAKKSSYTYYLPDARQTKEVLEYYHDQFKSIGSLEFECKGRACGSSSYWANKIFKSAKLYGPEQFQSYAVFRTSAGWWTVYIGQRATRKIYARLDHYFLGEKAD